MKTICICGAGTMGTGIAQVCAQGGFKTIVFDVDEQSLQKSARQVRDSFAFLKSKGKINDEQQASLLHQINFVSNADQCCGDLIIEAISENLGLKRDLFTALSHINGAETIFATNTSSLSISAIQQALPCEERVIGLHFFNPAPVMKLVEIIKGNNTCLNTVEKVSVFCNQVNKIPVLCKDSPGFIVNRVARQFYLEALRLAESGEMSVQDIDKIMEASGFKMGPFRLMDLIGLDVNLAVTNSIYVALGYPERLAPSPLQINKVEAGELGIKTSKGFYNY